MFTLSSRTKVLLAVFVISIVAFGFTLDYTKHHSARVSTGRPIKLTIDGYIYSKNIIDHVLEKILASNLTECVGQVSHNLCYVKDKIYNDKLIYYYITIYQSFENISKTTDNIYCFSAVDSCIADMYEVYSSTTFYIDDQSNIVTYQPYSENDTYTAYFLIFILSIIILIIIVFCFFAFGCKNSSHICTNEHPQDNYKLAVNNS